MSKELQAVSMLIKNSFEYFFVFAAIGLALHLLFFRRIPPKKKAVQVFGAAAFLTMIVWRLVFPRLESSRYFSPLIPWLILCVAFFFHDLNHLLGIVTKWKYARVSVFTLTFLFLASFCLGKTLKRNRYIAYIPELSGIISRDSRSENNPLIICWDNNENRFLWYTGLSRAYPALLFECEDKPDLTRLGKLTAPFRYYDGSIYFVVPENGTLNATNETLSLPESAWFHLSEWFTDRRRKKKIHIYKMRGGDLLRAKYSETGKEIAFFNGTFDGKTENAAFVTASPDCRIEVGPWPAGWIPLHAKSGTGWIGLTPDDSGNALHWKGEGEVIVCNRGMIPEDRELLLSFSAEGEPGSMYSIVQDRFDAGNRLIGRRIVAISVINDIKETTNRIRLPGPNKHDQGSIFYRIGVVFYNGVITLDDWHIREYTIPEA